MEVRLRNMVLSFVAGISLLIASSIQANAEIEDKLGLKFYGSFLYSEKVPNALFFFSDIEKNDSFELRKALRNHDIDILVLSSKGGSVWEGLNMAGIIYDKELITYVPKLGLSGEGNCASACAFMFFGGNTRIADGKLGVHQFYSGSASESAKIGTTQKVAQFTVSEIIGFLNEFKTPPFVYERMFQQSDMYYFDKKELDKIARVVEPLKQEERSSISSFINDFKVELASLDVDEDPPVTEPVKKVEPKKAPTPKKKTPVVTERTKPEEIEKPSTSDDILVCDNPGKVIGKYKTNYIVDYTAVKIFDFPKIKEASKTGETRGSIKYCFQWGCSATWEYLVSRSGPNSYLTLTKDDKKLYFDNRYSSLLFTEAFEGESTSVMFKDCKINNNYKVKTTTTKTKTATVQEPVKTKVEIVKGIQTELNRLNCNAGTADGVIGNRTRSALKRYASASGKVLGELLLTKQWFLNELETTKVKCLTPSIPKNPKTLICDTPEYSENELGIQKLIIHDYASRDYGNNNVLPFTRTKGTNHKVTICSKSTCWDELHKYEHIYATTFGQNNSDVPVFQPKSSKQGRHYIFDYSGRDALQICTDTRYLYRSLICERRSSRFLINNCR